MQKCINFLSMSMLFVYFYMQVHQMEYISFLAALNPVAYALIESIYHKYGNSELKGQKSKQSLQKPSCSPSKFRCLRGDLQEGEVTSPY